MGVYRGGVRKGVDLLAMIWYNGRVERLRVALQVFCIAG